MRCGPVAVLGLAFGVWTPPEIPAQQATASIHGRLVNRETRLPIEGATILLTSTNARLTSDAHGGFVYRLLLPGNHLVHVRALGYAPAAWLVELLEGEAVDREFELRPAPVELPGVAVEGPVGLAHRRLVDFERRRARGLGHFFTRQDIDQRNPPTLNDLLTSVRGVRLECAGYNQCAVRMVRSPRGCMPQYFVDGRESATWSVANISPQDIEGLEVYLGPSETPGEFMGPNSGCGVVAIWTRAAP